MTDDDALAAFEREMLLHDGDKEWDHQQADAFVARLLEDSGFPKLAAAYKARCESWWYA